VAAGRSEAAAALALLAAACSTREPEVTPFRITAVDATGASLTAAPAPASILLGGTAARAGPAAIVVQPPTGPAVTLAFQPVDGVGFPDQVAQGPIAVELRVDPAGRGPGGAPLPVRGMRVADANGRVRLFLAEGDLRDEVGRPIVPRPVDPGVDGIAIPDLPAMDVVTPGSTFEPSDCGDVYYDRLRVRGTDEVVIDRGEEATVAVPAGGDLPPWRVRLVQAFHRTAERGGGECAGAVRAWFQAAGSR
jgi:hypothetical protein